ARGLRSPRATPAQDKMIREKMDHAAEAPKNRGPSGSRNHLVVEANQTVRAVYLIHESPRFDKGRNCEVEDH
ncbi:MAG: hypothetical protein WBL84_06680, partial [Xanthobacteraceae bacterium]